MVSGEKSAVRWINCSPECRIHLVFHIYPWLSAEEEVGQWELAVAAGWRECKAVRPVWETCWRFLTQLLSKRTDAPAIVLLAIYAKELKTHVHPKTCAWMFIEALFRVVRSGKQQRRPSVREWKNRGASGQWNIYSMRWGQALRNLKSMLGSESGQSEEAPSGRILTTDTLGKAQLRRQ